jgi:hypothetical protein
VCVFGGAIIKPNIYMRVLELYSGYESLGNTVRGLGFSVVSCSLEGFCVLDHPVESNRFDIVFVNINNRGLVFVDGVESDCMIMGQEYIEYYNPKYFIILDNNIGIEDDIIMWGLPFQVIKQLRGGQIVNTRVWNNVFKWRPRFSSVYILPKTILVELLGCVRFI